MKLRRAHRVLKLCACDDVTEERISLQQDVIVEKDVVDANDALFAQDAIIEIMQAAAHLQANSKMSVVVKIGSCRDNPIDKPGAHQGNDCGHPQPGRRHRSRHAHSHRYVVCQHTLAEEVARLPEPRSVIRVECFVDQVNDGNVRIDGGRFNSLSVQETILVAHRENILPYGSPRTPVICLKSQPNKKSPGTFGVWRPQAAGDSFAAPRGWGQGRQFLSN